MTTKYASMKVRQWLQILFFIAQAFEYFYCFHSLTWMGSPSTTTVLQPHLPPKYVPSLSFVGLPIKTIIFQSMELEAKWVAAVLLGQSMLPGEEDLMPVEYRPSNTSRWIISVRCYPVVVSLIVRLDDLVCYSVLQGRGSSSRPSSPRIWMPTMYAEGEGNECSIA